MEKESYSIDDILSEVKKRREENERVIKGEEEPVLVEKNSSKEEVATQESIEFKLDTEDTPVEEAPEEEALVLNEDAPAEEPVIEDEPLEIVEEAPVEEPVADATIIAPAIKDEPKTEGATEVFSPAADENEPVKPEPPAPEEAAVVKDNQIEKEQMVDLFALADEPEPAPAPEEPAKKDKKGGFFKTKKGKVIKGIIIALVVLIVGAAVFGIIYANGLLNQMTGNSPEETYEKETYYDGMDFLQEDFQSIDEMSAYDVYSYKEYLKQWYKNGDPVSSTHVLNVLLIGEDTRDEQISDSSRADAAIIASINIDTGEIHLTSILRDLYVYFETEYGNESTGQYGKINAAASNGGMKCYIKTLERYYKISIDNYAVVNFASFPKIIDALDGVNIKITSAEIREINNHPKTYGGVTITQDFDGTEGKMKLNGKQALAFCRIRHIDSDGKRADRQKIVLNAIIKKVQKSGKLDTVKVVNQLGGYVYTGYQKKELIEIGNTALRDGWLDYELKSTNLPSPENAKGGQKFSVAPGNWIWLSDIPADAYNLQMEIYGKSNIKLNDNRPDYIQMGR